MKRITIEGGEDVVVSDGFHTMDELYDHRIALYIALCRKIDTEQRWDNECAPGPKSRLSVWRSKLHSDGTGYDGWFILGINEDKGQQITYHLPMSEWEETNFAETLEKAPEWDGHTSSDVLGRLKLL